MINPAAPASRIMAWRAKTATLPTLNVAILKSDSRLGE
jgi:hypothetical protein